MSPPGFVAAAVLMTVLALAHSVLGERYILRRLDRRDQPKLFGDDSFTKQTLRFAWHALTIIWLAVAMALVAIPSTGLGWIVVAALGATATITIVISRARHLSWVVELAMIGALLAELL